MKKEEITKLKQWCKDKLGEDWDLFDIDAHMDSSLTIEENKRILTEKIDTIIPSKEEVDDFKSKEMKFKMEETDFKEKYLKERNPLDRTTLDKFKTIAIYGDTGSGKTALAYKILEQFKDRPIFFIKHPNPKVIRKMGYANLRSLEELERLENCVIYYDEPQLSISIYDNKANRIISRVCSLARQRNIKLIISSSDTRVFGKHNEAYFDMWLVKDVDYSMVKNGSKIKKAIQDNAILEPTGFRLEQDEYLVENRKMSELNGKHKFKLPKSWNDEHSKPYSNPEKNGE